MPTPVLLILTAAGFGASPLLIAEAVAYFPPWTLAALRAALGLPLLMMAAGFLGSQNRLGLYDLVTALVGGTLVVAIPFVSMAAGLQYIPSGMGGMLYATMPLFTLALAAMFLPDEPATVEQAIRIGTGLVGVALISIPAIAAGGFSQAGFGTLMVLLSPLSYAAGNVWFRRRRKMAPLVLSAGMFAVGALTLWPLALLIDGTPHVAPSAGVIGILAALVVLATIAPNLLNYALVQQAGANRAALAMFMMPGFSVAFGLIFRGERLLPLALIGLAMVILASTARVPGRLRRRPVPAGVPMRGAVRPAMNTPVAPKAESVAAAAAAPAVSQPVTPPQDAAAQPAPGPGPGNRKRKRRPMEELTPAERKARRQARRKAEAEALAQAQAEQADADAAARQQG